MSNDTSFGRIPLHWQMLIAIIMAAIAGALVDKETVVLGLQPYGVFSFIGELFMNALKMLIVPLVASSIICGIANTGGAEGLGRLGGKTLAFYMGSSLAAILVGLLVVNILTPGLNDGQPAHSLFTVNHAEVAEKLERVEGRSTGDIVDVFIRMVPPNIVMAAAEGQMLGLIFFSLLFGFFMTRLASGQQQTQLSFWQGLQDIMMHMTMFVMKFAPIGVFGLIAKTVSTTGLEIFGNVFVFFITVVIALFIHAFITMALVLKFIARVNPFKHYKAMSEAMLMAFSSASSAATLPLTMECVEEKAGVSNKTSSFVLPLGATVNMDGTALYECVAAMFIAQAYGLELGFGVQFTIVLIALLTSIGVAGIPAASLVAITVILAAIGLPLEGIGLLLVTDRLLDMMRTAVNVFGDSCCAVTIARSEGEETKLL